MQFQDDLAGGVTLIRPALQSPGYAPGASGWSVNLDGTAEFADLTIRSSDGSGATVDVQNGKVICTAANGWKVTIDPTLLYPVIYFQDSTGTNMGALNASGVEGQAAIVQSSGPFPDGAVDDWRWVQVMGETDGGGNRAILSRMRDSDATEQLGGMLFLDADKAQLALFDTKNPSRTTVLQIDQNRFVLDEGDLVVNPRPSARPAIWLVAQSGHTGHLLRLQNGPAVMTTVDKDGNLDTAGALRAGNLQSGKVLITPTVANEWTANVAVTFPRPFAVAPEVMLTCTLNGPGTATTTELEWCAANVTTTGFNARIRRGNLTATTLSWFALST